MLRYTVFLSFLISRILSEILVKLITCCLITQLVFFQNIILRERKGWCFQQMNLPHKSSSFHLTSFLNFLKRLLLYLVRVGKSLLFMVSYSTMVCTNTRVPLTLLVSNKNWHLHFNILTISWLAAWHGNQWLQLLRSSLLNFRNSSKFSSLRWRRDLNMGWRGCKHFPTLHRAPPFPLLTKNIKRQLGKENSYFHFYSSITFTCYYFTFYASM